MLGHLIRKEMLDHLLGFRFLILSTLGALIIWLSLYSGYTYYQDTLKDYRLAQASTEDRIREIAASETRVEFVSIGYMEHKPPTPMSIFIRGLEPTMGRSISIATTIQRSTRSPVEVRPLLGVFPPLDLGLVVQVVIGLFVLLLTYDAVCGEKEGGTLRLTASFPVPRHYLLLGKLIGVLVTAWTAFGLPLLLGIAVVLMMPDVQVANAEWTRLGLIFLSFVLYLTTFTCAGLLASCMTQRAGTAFVLLLAFWVSTVVVLPRLSLILADSIHPAPSVYELEAEKEVVAKSNGDRWGEARRKWTQDHPKWQDTPEGREAYRLYWRKTRQEVWRDPNLLTHKRLEEGFRSRYNVRLDLAVGVARFSPAFAFNHATVRLAGAGLDRQQRFQDAYDLYYQRYYDWYIDSTDRDELRKINPAKYGTYKWDISDLPRLTYREAWPEEEIQGALIDVGVLALWGLAFFAGAYVSMLRYDLR